MEIRQIIMVLQITAVPIAISIAVASMQAWGNAMIYASQMIYQAYINPELKTGKDKMDWVVMRVKKHLPSIIGQIVSDGHVRALCQEIYDAVKAYATATAYFETLETFETQRAGGEQDV